MNNRRKRLTVPREFRNRFIILPLCIILIGFNLVILANMFFAGATVLQIFQPNTLFLIAIMEIAFVFWAVLTGALTAHRTAGPMVALEKGLNRIGRGDLTTTVKFRKNDFNQNIADSFNQNIEKLREQVVTIKQLTEKLEHELPENQVCQEVLDQLKQELDYIET